LLLILGVAFVALGTAALFGRFNPRRPEIRKMSYAYCPLGFLFIAAAFEEQIIRFIGIGRVPIVVIYALLSLWAIFWLRWPPVRQPR